MDKKTLLAVANAADDVSTEFGAWTGDETSMKIAEAFSDFADMVRRLANEEDELR